MFTRYRLLPLYILIAALPTVLTFILLIGGLGVRLDDYQPIWIDEITYWHESATFHAVGFDGGYYTAGERPASASFTHFGPHGFGYAALTGLAARLFGWSYYGIPIFNAVILTAALTLYLLVTRPRGVELGIAILLIVGWYPVALYLAVSMQEVFHHGIAALLAVGFVVLLRQGSPLRVRRAAFIALLGVIALASLVRVAWALAFIPLFALAVTPASDRQSPDRRARIAALIPALIIGVIVTVLAAAFYLWTTGVFAGGFLGVWQRELPHSRFFGLSLIYGNAVQNLARLIQGSPFEIILRIQLIALVALALISLLIAWRKRHEPTNRFLLPARESLLIAFMLGGIFALQLTLYDVYDWRDFRVFAPVVFFCLLLLLARGRWQITAALLALHVIALLGFWNIFTEFHLPKFTYGREPITAFGDAIAGHIAYDPDAQSPWCNTLLMSQHTPELLALPPGVGFVSSNNLRDTDNPPRSRYLLLMGEDLEWAERTTRMESLVDTEIGIIYLNLDADC